MGHGRMSAIYTTSIDRRRLEDHLRLFIEHITRDTGEFGPADPSPETRYQSGRDDINAFAGLYTPHYTDLPSAPFHQQLHAMCNYTRRRHLFIAPGPREHGKSIQLRIAKLHMVLYGTKHFILKISETLKLAQRDLDYIAVELTHNPRIRQDFQIKFVKDTEDTLQLRVRPKTGGAEHQVMLQALSYGTPCIGLTFLQHRPDFGDIDDFEDRRSARNPRIAQEKVDWIISQLLLAMDSHNGVLIWLGNNHAKTSAMNQALEKETSQVTIHTSVYTGRRNAGTEINASKGMVSGHIYPAWIRKGKRRYALWPAKMNLKELDRLRDEIGPHRFEAEMQQNPIEVGNYFNADDMDETYESLPPAGRRIWGAWIDQSLGKGKTADFKAGWIVVSDGRQYFIVDGFLRQMSLRAMVRSAYDLYEKWQHLGFRVWHIENNFGQYTYISRRDFTDESETRGYPLPVKPADNTIDKDLRIQGLEPLFGGRKILWPKIITPDMKRLKEQLLGYPDFPFKDGPDALSSAMEVARILGLNRNHTQYRPLSKRRYPRR